MVGPEQHRFDVHKGLLCTKSKFFKAACSENFKEAEGRILIPSQEAGTFKYFVYWLYTGKISGFYYHDKISPSIDELKSRIREALDGDTWYEVANEKKHPCLIDFHLANYRDLPFNGLISLYVLADFLDVCGLKDVIIKALVKVYLNPYDDISLRCSIMPLWDHDVERTQWCPDPANGINLAWETFGKDDPLCKALLQIFSSSCNTVIPFPQGDILNASFVTAAYEWFFKHHRNYECIFAYGTSGMLCRYEEHLPTLPYCDPGTDEYGLPELPE